MLVSSLQRRDPSQWLQRENAEQRDAEGVTASALHDLGQSLHAAEENSAERGSDSPAMGSPAKRRRGS
eukprot:5309342-Amphidinium_carterae.1